MHVDQKYNIIIVVAVVAIVVVVIVIIVDERQRSSNSTLTLPHCRKVVPNSGRVFRNITRRTFQSSLQLSKKHPITKMITLPVFSCIAQYLLLSLCFSYKIAFDKFYARY